MQYKVTSAIAFSLFGIVLLKSAWANEVQYTVNKPTTIVYQLVHQNSGQKPILGARQSMQIEKKAAVPVDLQGYQFAGVVTDNIDGHELPANAKQFGAMESCTMNTDKTHTSGMLKVTIQSHEISCAH